MKNTLLLFVIFLLFACVPNQNNKDDSQTQNNVPAPNFCDCPHINRDDGIEVVQCVSFPVASDKSKEVALSISKSSNVIYIAVSIKYSDVALKITDDLHIRLKDNTMLSFSLVNSGLSNIGNSQLAQAVFLLDEAKVQKLINSDLSTISIKLDDNYLHTLECKSNISVLKEQLNCNSESSENTSPSDKSDNNLQSNNSTSTFYSNKYNYTISIPDGFEKATASGTHIDLKLVHKDGSSILVNISERYKEEYNITAHDYTKEFLQNQLNQTTHKTQITKIEKIFIANNKAVLYYFSDLSVSTKSIECIFFKGNYCYMLTATSGSVNFIKHESQFLKSLKSIIFD